MATRTVVILTCDLHEDSHPAVRTATFEYGDVPYSFELCEEHLAQVDATMGRYVEAARRQRS